MLRNLALTFLSCLLFACASGGSARAAPPSFDVIRATAVFRAGVVDYATGTPACLVVGEGYNAGNSGSWYLNGAFVNKPSFGEGCEYDVVRRSDGSFVGRFHYQNWVYSRYTCPGGYSGPFTDASGNKECRRNIYVPVVKPPVCPNPLVGHPIEVASADKTLSVTDIENIDRIGFSRTYRSRPRVSGGYQFPSMLGGSWYGEHFQRLKLLIGGTSNLPSMIHMVRPDGAPWIFLKDEAGSWISERDALCTHLTEVTLDDGARGYDLTLPGGEIESFDSEGVLLEINYTDGGKLSYHYGQDGLLNNIKNTKGRELWVCRVWCG